MKNRFFLVVLSAAVCIRCEKDLRPFRPETAEGFAIYAANDRYSSAIQLDSLTLSPEPFLTVRDIMGYHWSSHRITYGVDTYRRLLAWGNLYGRLFVVMAGGERIYWGVFTSPISSMGYRNPVILLDPGPGGHALPREITIDRSYPAGWATGEDARSDPRIYDSLKRAGVLLP
jgi:hypothetical protein